MLYTSHLLCNHPT